MTTIIHSMDIVVALKMPLSTAESYTVINGVTGKVSLSTAGSPTVVTGVTSKVSLSTAGSPTVVTGRTSKVSTCQLFMLRSEIISITDIVISAVSLTMCSFVSDGLAAVTTDFRFHCRSVRRLIRGLVGRHIGRHIGGLVGGLIGGLVGGFVSRRGRGSRSGCGFRTP